MSSSTAAFPSTASSTSIPQSSSANADNSSNFSVLAAGTQDLAALVGIFASDSVEPYAFNYGRGWLSPLASTLSLLGVLGYIRGLVKLGLGRDGCRKAGFDMKAERTFFGILDEDWLPPGAVHQVTYLQRHRDADSVAWSANRRIKHTLDSMPILREAVSSPPPERSGVIVNTCQLEYKVKHFRSGYGHFVVPSVAAIFVGLTTLTIIPLRSRPRHMAWSWYFATIGMFISLFSSFMLWSWVYAQEMLPHQQSDWADRTSHDPHHQRLSLEKRDYFAYIQSDQRFVTFDLRAIKGRTRWLVRIFSFSTAVLGLFSYVCQYIELRAMSSHRSAIWLGVQGILALIRVSIWVIDPAFDDLKRGEAAPSSIEQAGNVDAQRSPELFRDSLTIPNWVLDVLDLNETEISRAFELAYSLYSESPKDPGWANALEIFRNVRRVWDFPEGFLDWWIEAHALQAFSVEPQERRDSLGCRIIEDNNGRYHYLPYYQRLTYKFQIFGDPRVEEKTVYTSLNEQTTDKSSAHRDGLRVGWPSSVSHETIDFVQSGRTGSGLSLQRLNTRTQDSISKVMRMWDDLVGILRREKTVVFRKQAEFLKDPSGMGISSKAMMRHHLSSDSDIEASELGQKTRQGNLKKTRAMRIFENARTT
ncbi:hypothetical protein ABVK25_011376 [Lepraria finkii]|uniref:Uncharacterized protein n=1 Tax=Lepraria finkii TaxID=1340010 RepID=A0ABR4AT01_9LECA